MQRPHEHFTKACRHPPNGWLNCRVVTNEPLQFLGRFRLEICLPRQHLKQHYTDRPDVGTHVHIPCLQAFRRRIWHRPKLVKCHAPRHGDGLRDAEVQNFNVALGGDPDVTGLNIPVDNAAMLPVIDHGAEGMGSGQNLQDIEGNRGGPPGLYRAPAHQFRKVFPFDVLHRNEEVAVEFPNLKYLGNAAAGLTLRQLVLQLGAAVLGSDNVEALLIRAKVNQLEADFTIQTRVVGQKDAPHPAASEFPADLVSPKDSRIQTGHGRAVLGRTTWGAGAGIATGGNSSSRIAFFAGRPPKKFSSSFSA